MSLRTRVVQVRDVAKGGAVGYAALYRAPRDTRVATLRLDADVIEYFKSMSDETGIPYQKLINLYLRDCVESHKTLELTWAC